MLPYFILQGSLFIGGGLTSSIIPLSTIKPSQHATRLRTHQVISYLDSIGHVLDWEQLDNDTRRTTLTHDDWLRWETEALALSSAGELDLGLDLSFGGDILSDDAALDRSILCYGSGSWARDFTLAALYEGVCNSFAYGVRTGSIQILQSLNLLNENNDQMSVYWRFALYVEGFSSATSCKAALAHLIEQVCQGKKSDTRGGESKSSADKFTVDPTTLNCNC